MKMSNRTERHLLALAVEGGLLGGGLEATVTELGGSIDELEGDLLGGVAAGLRNESLAQSDDALLGTDDAALDHDVVVVDNTVVGEATERSDSLLGKIGIGGSVVVNTAIFFLGGAAHLVDLLVDLGTVVITILTSASDGELHSGRVPGTNTGDLAETTVSLTGETGDAPTGGDTFETVTLGCANGIDHLILVEDVADGDEAFEEVLTEVDLLGDGTTVDLDLHEVSLLLTEVQLAHVSVSEHADDVAVLLDALEFGVGAIAAFLLVVGEALSVLGEGLFLGVVPVLVESSLDLVVQVLSPDGGEGTETTGSLDVSDQTNNNHRGGLDDGDGFDDFLVVDLRSGLVGLTEDVGHTGLVAHEGSEVAWLGSIVLGELSDAASVVRASFAGEEPEGPVAGSFKFTV